VPDSTHQPLPQPHLPLTRGLPGLSQLPAGRGRSRVLLGDLTGRYAAGSYSGLGSDGRTLALCQDRQGAAEHGHRVTAPIACHIARAGGTADQLTRLLLHPEH
jgi:hypothetical protein